MSPNVDPKKSHRRQQSFFDGFEPRKYLLSGKIFLYVLGLLLLVLVLSLLVYDFVSFARTSKQLSVQLEVHNNETISTTEIRRLLSDSDAAENNNAHPAGNWALRTTEGETVSLFVISPEAVEERLRDSFDRFRDVKVGRILPRTLRIEVDEREPYARVARRVNERLGYLPADRRGVLFNPRPDEREWMLENLIPVYGLETLAEETDKYRKRWESFSRVREAFETMFDDPVEQKYIFNPGGSLVVELSRPNQIEVHFGRENFDEKVLELYDIMSREGFYQIEDYIDLSNLEDIRAR